MYSKRIRGQVSHGTYRHYIRRADGTLRFMGTVDYSYVERDTGVCTHDDRARELARRDAFEADRLAEECAAFEDLVDAACEGGR